MYIFILIALVIIVCILFIYVYLSFYKNGKDIYIEKKDKYGIKEIVENERWENSEILKKVNFKKVDKLLRENITSNNSLKKPNDNVYFLNYEDKFNKGIIKKREGKIYTVESNDGEIYEISSKYVFSRDEINRLVTDNKYDRRLFNFKLRENTLLSIEKVIELGIKDEKFTKYLAPHIKNVDDNIIIHYEMKSLSDFLVSSMNSNRLKAQYLEMKESEESAEKNSKNISKKVLNEFEILLDSQRQDSPDRNDENLVSETNIKKLLNIREFVYKNYLKYYCRYSPENIIEGINESSKLLNYDEFFKIKVYNGKGEKKKSKRVLEVLENYTENKKMSDEEKSYFEKVKQEYQSIYFPYKNTKLLMRNFKELDYKINLIFNSFRRYDIRFQKDISSLLNKNNLTKKNPIRYDENLKPIDNDKFYNYIVDFTEILDKNYKGTINFWLDFFYDDKNYLAKERLVRILDLAVDKKQREVFITSLIERLDIIVFPPENVISFINKDIYIESKYDNDLILKAIYKAVKDEEIKINDDISNDINLESFYRCRFNQSFRTKITNTIKVPNEGYTEKDFQEVDYPVNDERHPGRGQTIILDKFEKIDLDNYPELSPQKDPVFILNSRSAKHVKIINNFKLTVGNNAGRLSKYVYVYNGLIENEISSDKFNNSLIKLERIGNLMKNVDENPDVLDNEKRLANMLKSIKSKEKKLNYTYVQNTIKGIEKYNDSLKEDKIRVIHEINKDMRKTREYGFDKDMGFNILKYFKKVKFDVELVKYLKFISVNEKNQLNYQNKSTESNLTKILELLNENIIDAEKLNYYIRNLNWEHYEDKNNELKKSIPEPFNENEDLDRLRFYLFSPQINKINMKVLAPDNKTNRFISTDINLFVNAETYNYLGIYYNMERNIIYYRAWGKIHKLNTSLFEFDSIDVDTNIKNINRLMHYYSLGYSRTDYKQNQELTKLIRLDTVKHRA